VNKKTLYIVGAGGFGREIFSAVSDVPEYGVSFAVGGFIDDDLNALDGYEGYPSVVGTLKDFNYGSASDVFFVAIGNVEIRKRCVEFLRSKGCSFITLIHKTASVGKNVKLGEGVYIAHNAVLTADIEVGDNSYVFHSSTIGHDVEIGNCSHVSSHVFIGGGVKIGDLVTLQPGSKIVPRVEIKDGAEVGISSVVISNVKAKTKVFGNPAVKLPF
jgi:sugar O-acyltransferase (sialic acid O-acetyltransferase NeuD family)